MTSLRCLASVKTKSITLTLYSPKFFYRITNSIKIASIIFRRVKNGLKSAYLCAFRALYSHSKTACRGFESFCPCQIRITEMIQFRLSFFSHKKAIFRLFDNKSSPPESSKTLYFESPVGIFLFCYKVIVWAYGGNRLGFYYLLPFERL